MTPSTDNTARRHIAGTVRRGPWTAGATWTENSAGKVQAVQAVQVNLILIEKLQGIGALPLAPWPQRAPGPAIPKRLGLLDCSDCPYEKRSPGAASSPGCVGPFAPLYGDGFVPTLLASRARAPGGGAASGALDARASTTAAGFPPCDCDCGTSAAFGRALVAGRSYMVSVCADNYLIDLQKQDLPDRVCSPSLADCTPCLPVQWPGTTVCAAASVAQLARRRSRTDPGRPLAGAIGRLVAVQTWLTRLRPGSCFAVDCRRICARPQGAGGFVMRGKARWTGGRGPNAPRARRGAGPLRTVLVILLRGAKNFFKNAREAQKEKGAVLRAPEDFRWQPMRPLSVFGVHKQAGLVHAFLQFAKAQRFVASKAGYVVRECYGIGYQRLKNFVLCPHRFSFAVCVPSWRSKPKRSRWLASTYGKAATRCDFFNSSSAAVV